MGKRLPLERLCHVRHLVSQQLCSFRSRNSDTFRLDTTGEPVMNRHRRHVEIARKFGCATSVPRKDFSNLFSR